MRSLTSLSQFLSCFFLPTLRFSFLGILINLRFTNENRLYLIQFSPMFCSSSVVGTLSCLAVLAACCISSGFISYNGDFTTNIMFDR